MSGQGGDMNKVLPKDSSPFKIQKINSQKRNTLAASDPNVGYKWHDIFSLWKPRLQMREGGKI
jgi:hypothetical protein